MFVNGMFVHRRFVTGKFANGRFVRSRAWPELSLSLAKSVTKFVNVCNSPVRVKVRQY